MVLRVGWAELVLAGALLLGFSLVTLGLVAGWTIALVPGVTYTLALVLIYAGVRLYLSPEIESSVPFEAVAHFKVVGVRGRCLMSREEGDVIKVGPAGGVTPVLCGPAERVLRSAAGNSDAEVDEWCCPIHDHMLVFRQANHIRG
jgi:hypothetical protein